MAPGKASVVTVFVQPAARQQQTAGFVILAAEQGQFECSRAHGAQAQVLQHGWSVIQPKAAAAQLQVAVEGL